MTHANLPRPLPDGPINAEPRGYGVMGQPANAGIVLAALERAGVELGARDRVIAEWLGAWETATVVTIASWLTRATGTTLSGVPDPDPNCRACGGSGREWYTTRGGEFVNARCSTCRDGRVGP